jgi:hypothetical protein
MGGEGIGKAEKLKSLKLKADGEFLTANER